MPDDKLAKIDTHGIVVDFGKHEGTLYTRVPVSYLQWMVNANHTKRDIAEAELERRGTTYPDIVISGHAIDRASFACLKTWKEDRQQDEGLHSWLIRHSLIAIQEDNLSEEDDTIKVRYLGFQWVFATGEKYPSLKTIMRKGKKKKKAQSYEHTTRGGTWTEPRQRRSRPQLQERQPRSLPPKKTPLLPSGK